MFLRVTVVFPYCKCLSKLYKRLVARFPCPALSVLVTVFLRVTGFVPLIRISRRLPPFPASPSSVDRTTPRLSTLADPSSGQPDAGCPAVTLGDCRAGILRNTNGSVGDAVDAAVESPLCWEGVGVGVGVGAGVGVGVAEGVRLGVALGVALGVRLGVGAGVGIGVDETEESGDEYW